jgi:hypothetical protein
MIGSRANLPDRYASLCEAEVDAALKRLHGTGAASELSRLHEEAARRLNDARAIRFHLTHAWVFAMEGGEQSRADALAETLREAGGLD